MHKWDGVYKTIMFRICCSNGIQKCGTLLFFFLQVVRLILFFCDASVLMDLNIESCCHLKGYLIYCDVNVLISNNQKLKKTYKIQKLKST